MNWQDVRSLIIGMILGAFIVAALVGCASTPEPESKRPFYEKLPETEIA